MVKMRYGVNSFSYTWTHSVADCVPHLARMGFDEFELMTMPGHLWPDELDAARRGVLAAQFRDLGITLRSLNHTSLDQNLTSPLPEVRAYTVGLFLKLIALARDLGAANVIVVPGRLNALLPAPIERHLDWLQESLSLIAPVASDHGVRLALENIPMGPIPRIGDMLAMRERVDSAALRLCYDVANAHFAGEDPVAGLEAAAPWLDVVHYSDTTRRAWRHDAIGDGDIDFAPVLSAVREIGHARKPLIELTVREPDADLRRSVAALDRLAAR